MALVIVFPATSSTSCGNGDNEGDGCKRGLADIDGDGLGVKNGPGGDNIPAKNKGNWKLIGGKNYETFLKKFLCKNISIASQNNN